MEKVQQDDRKVVILNRLWLPIGVCGIRRAVSLLLRKRGSPASDKVYWVRTPSGAFPVPCRLVVPTTYRPPPRAPSSAEVLRRYKYTCAYCGARPGDFVNGQELKRAHFTVDHVVPRSRGGTTTWDNLVCACIWCNQKKANRLPEEAGMPWPQILPLMWDESCALVLTQGESNDDGEGQAN